VPLIEIISEPDLRSAEEARDYLEGVRALLGALDICNCRMQEGTIRCDVNVSVRPAGQEEYGTRVEIKNINSFSGAALAIGYEAERQVSILESGGRVDQETRRWDDSKNASVLMRSKENATDYRYFPESDLDILEVDDTLIDQVRAALPELPVAKFERYKNMGIAEADCRLLVENADKAAYFEKCAEIGGVSPKTAVNWIIGDLTARLNKNMIPTENSPVPPGDLCDMIGMIERGVISNDSGKRILDEMFAGKNSGSPEEIAQRLSLSQVSGEDELRRLVLEVVDANAKSAEDYRNGKSNAFGFIVGQCMKASKGKANPQVINKLLKEILG
jgi:aspartyl-tRNA(Asn)/glutamyl-tRNA(Gln) amidotransferase subunit B